MQHLFARLIAMARPLSIAAGLALFNFSNAATAAVVTFDFEKYAIGSYGSDLDYSSGALVSDGFVLDPGQADWSPNAQAWIGHYHITDGITESGYVDGYNGTKYFGFDYYFDDSRLNVYGVAGSVFGVRQLDLVEGDMGSGSSVCIYGVPTPYDTCQVTFIGQLASGGTISRVISLDGIHDETGPLIDFETFTFDGQWNRLTMFSIVSAHGFLNPGMDNLVLRTVPEPGSVALLFLGLAGLALGRRSKH